jgi:hypothetical protein
LTDWKFGLTDWPFGLTDWQLGLTEWKMPLTYGDVDRPAENCRCTADNRR